jgi:16S rRNA pseudouridine516 synthase
MTIVEGRYHQVKRMLAAVGNHVAAQLHRSSIGNYAMPADLKEGQWRWIDPHEMALLAQPIE